MDSTRLAGELASRMADVVPREIRVSVEDDVLVFKADVRWRSGSYACRWLNEGAAGPEDLIVEACWRAFDDLQDFVDETTTQPWPADHGTPPRPAARIEDRRVIIWFGEPEAPVLVLEPLPLDL